jgi:hypothetical protein
MAKRLQAMRAAEKNRPKFIGRNCESKCPHLTMVGRNPYGSKAFCHRYKKLLEGRLDYMGEHPFRIITRNEQCLEEFPRDE